MIMVVILSSNSNHLIHHSPPPRPLLPPVAASDRPLLPPAVLPPPARPLAHSKQPPTAPLFPSRPCTSSVCPLLSCASPLARSPVSSARWPSPLDHLPPPIARPITHTHPRTPVPSAMPHGESLTRRKVVYSASPATRRPPLQRTALGGTSPEACGPRWDVIREVCVIVGLLKAGGARNTRLPTVGMRQKGYMQDETSTKRERKHETKFFQCPPDAVAFDY